MRKILSTVLLLLSTTALADVSYKEIEQANRDLARACSSGSNSDCANAGRRKDEVSQRLNQGLAGALSRTPEESRRRNQVIQEEQWRDEYRRR